MTHYTSLKLSKMIQEVGFKLESCADWVVRTGLAGEFILTLPYNDSFSAVCPAYDILWDICIKYAKDFFESKEMTEYIKKNYSNPTKVFCGEVLGHTKKIFSMLQEDKPQEEIEDYIIANSVFFNNKEKGKDEQ